MAQTAKTTTNQKKSKIKLPASFNALFNLFTDAQRADREAQAAELALQTRLNEGLPETQTAVALVFDISKALKAENEDHVAAFFAGQKYWAYDPTRNSPDGIETVVPYGKPARANPAIAAAKLALPNRNKSWLTKIAAIVGYALDQKMTEDGFRDWLAGEHSKDGQVLGCGINSAYAAYCNGGGKSASTRPATGNATTKPAVDANALREAQQRAFKFGKVQRELKFNVPAKVKGNGTFMLLVQEDEHGVTTVVPMPLTDQSALDAYSLVENHYEANPSDTAWTVSVGGKPSKPPIAAALREASAKPATKKQAA